MEKFVIFGGSGFVGGNMTKTAQRKGWKVYIADSLYCSGLENVEWKTVNITDMNVISRIIEEIRPDAVVNMAVIADIDKVLTRKRLS